MNQTATTIIIILLNQFSQPKRTVDIHTHTNSEKNNHLQNGKKKNPKIGMNNNNKNYQTKVAVAATTAAANDNFQQTNTVVMNSMMMMEIFFFFWFENLKIVCVCMCAHDKSLCENFLVRKNKIHRPQKKKRNHITSHHTNKQTNKQSVNSDNRCFGFVASVTEALLRKLKMS